MEVERAARLLSCCNEIPSSVSDVAGRVGGNHEKAIELIRELEMRGLLLRNTRKRGRGRPQQLLRATPLGDQFLEQYKRLMDLRLRSNANDVERALRQAESARRLVDQRVSAYARFLELNELARNIASTAQTRRNPR